MDTNIKGLPEGEYFTAAVGSDSFPYQVLKRTAHTVTVVEVDVKPDPDWKPEITPGGFAGHCTNQAGQTWLFDRVRKPTMTLRRRKRGGWTHQGTRFYPDRAVYFRDYNF